MSAAPLDLNPWVERIREKVPALRKVGTAKDLATAQEALRTSPSAYVVPIADQPRQRAGFGNSTVSQNVDATVAIVVSVSSLRGAEDGSGATTEIQELRADIFAALLGWIPPGAATAIQFAGGRTLPFSDSTVHFSDRFTTSYFIRKEIAA